MDRLGGKGKERNKVIPNIRYILTNINCQGQTPPSKSEASGQVQGQNEAFHQSRELLPPSTHETPTRVPQLVWDSKLNAIWIHQSKKVRDRPLLCQLEQYANFNVPHKDSGLLDQKPDNNSRIPKHTFRALDTVPGLCEVRYEQGGGHSISLLLSHRPTTLSPEVRFSTQVEVWIELLKTGPENEYTRTLKIHQLGMLLMIARISGVHYLWASLLPTISTDVGWYKEKLGPNETIIVTIKFLSEDRREKLGCCWSAGAPIVGLAFTK